MKRFKQASLAMGIIIAGLLLSGCVSDRQVVSQAADVHNGLKPAVMTDSQLATYIQKVGDRIVAVAKQLDQQGYAPGGHKKNEDDTWMYQGMEFHLVNSKTLNAFTTGGKHMYVYSELLQSCKNEDELAAVMSHEYAHVYCRHVAEGMNRQYAQMGLAAAAGGAGYLAGGKDSGAEYASIAAGAAMVGGQFIGMGFTRKDEEQADQVGFNFYTRAGWDPDRFSGFFQTLIDKGMDTTPEMMSDHPKLSNRVQNVKAWAAALPPEAKSWRKAPVADDRQFAQIKQRVATVGKSMPDDKSLKQAQLLLSSFSSCVTPQDQPEQKHAQATLAKAVQQQQEKQQQTTKK